MTKRKGLLLALVALTLGLTAAAAAEETTSTTTTTTRTTIYEQYVYPVPPPPPVPSPPPSVTQYYPNRYCFTEGAYWRWDGVRYVWEPGRTVCRSS